MTCKHLRVVLGWRVGVVASAVTGVVLAAAQYAVWWTALSQLASVAVAVTWLVLAASPLVTGRPAPRATWLRGALATVMTLVSVGFLVGAHGNVLDPYSVFEHLLTPALVVVDFLVVGRSRRLARWQPLTWALVPVPYLLWYVVGDLRVYAALDPARLGSFVAAVGALLVLVLAAGYGLRGLHLAQLARPVRLARLARQVRPVFVVLEPEAT